MASSSASLIMPRVASRSGTWRVTTSERARMSSRDTRVTPSRASRSAGRSMASSYSSSHSQPARRWATFWPMWPRPMMPTVLPVSSWALGHHSWADALGPLPGLGGLHLDVQLAVDAEHECDGVLGHGDGVAAAAVRHEYADVGQAGHVEPVGAGAGHLHELQVRAATRHVDGPVAEDDDGVLHEGDLLVVAQVRVDPGDFGLRRESAKVLHLPVVGCEISDLGSHSFSCVSQWDGGEIISAGLPAHKTR